MPSRSNALIRILCLGSALVLVVPGCDPDACSESACGKQPCACWDEVENPREVQVSYCVSTDEFTNVMHLSIEDEDGNSLYECEGPSPAYDCNFVAAIADACEE